jgi:hypothetical protein
VRHWPSVVKSLPTNVTSAEADGPTIKKAAT